MIGWILAAGLGMVKVLGGLGFTGMMVQLFQYEGQGVV